MAVVLVYNIIQAMTTVIIPNIMMVQEYSIQHELVALNVSSIMRLDRKLWFFIHIIFLFSKWKDE